MDIPVLAWVYLWVFPNYYHSQGKGKSGAGGPVQIPWNKSDGSWDEGKLGMRKASKQTTSHVLTDCRGYGGQQCSSLTRSEKNRSKERGLRKKDQGTCAIEEYSSIAPGDELPTSAYTPPGVPKLPLTMSLLCPRPGEGLIQD